MIKHVTKSQQKSGGAGFDALAEERAPGNGSSGPSLLTRETGLAGFVERLDGARIRAIIVLVLFALVIAMLYRELEVTNWSDVRSALASTSLEQVLLAAGATGLSYVALAGYDLIALRLLRAPPVPLGMVALTSFISQAFTFTFGFGVLTGGAVRMRLYGMAGLRPDQIIAASLFATVAIWVGLGTVTAVALIFGPHTAESLLSLPHGTGRALGLIIFAFIVGGLSYAAAKSPKLPGSDVRAPGAAATGLTLLIGVLDVVSSALALWVLLPADVGIGFAGFLVIFTTAITLGVISHVPGGLGVFEGIILLGVPGSSHGALIAALLLFRIVYYLVPMALAAALLVLVEIRERGVRLPKGVASLGTALGAAIPIVSAVLVFLGGFILMISGATPAIHDRMAALRHVVPLPFVEASHFIASVAGTLLIILAYGLARRLESAWRAASVLLMAAAVFSLAKGFDYEEALVCMAIAGLLFAGRRWFYRQGGAFSGSLQASEILATGVAVGTSVWLGMLSFRDVAYSGSLWWDFAYHGDASRFLRASLGIAVTALVLTLYRLINRPALADSAPPAGLDEVRCIVAGSERAESSLALTGDKLFLFNEDRTGFVMYGVQGNSWVAMGDPVLSGQADAASLIWQFKELVDLHAGVPVFYQVSSELLPLYLESGFAMVKLGEEAWVDLVAFTLEGGAARRLRQTHTKMLRSGATFELVAAPIGSRLLNEMHSVSEQWLSARGRKEKGFSLGFWSDDYVRGTDVAVVRYEGRIAAFANMWRGADKREVTVDLMRARPDAIAGIMDLLFIGMMERAKAEGYRWFNLGMAPLSGLPQHRLAPLWSRVASWFFRHGDRFYKFEGLRSFKSKFHPEWRSKYLAYPQGRLLAPIIVDVAYLIANAPARVRGKDDG
jgi:phosphatidylglycerol lysyltransferase